MGSSIYTITIDCSDPDRVAAFWGQLLGWGRSYEDEDEVAIEGDEGPALSFFRVPEGKRVKNRIHFDLNPDNQEAEVARAKQLGATEIDIGQGDVSWVVLADPEGNEFCILTARDD